MACETDRAILAQLLNACDLKSGLVPILSGMCESINALTESIQRNTNNATTDLLPATQTVFELSDATVTEIPAGSLVGDTIVVQFDGLYRYAINFAANSTTIVENLTFEVLRNGVAYDTFTLNDNGVDPVILNDTFMGNFTTGDVISFAGTSPTGVINTFLGVDFELLIAK